MAGLPFWENDYRFISSYRLADGITLVDPIRCYMLYQFVHSSMNVPGEIAEIGVFKGGTARLISHAAGAKKCSIQLFDTFSGMPSTADPTKDAHRVGDFSDTTADAVSAMFADDPRVSIHVGLFPFSAERDQLQKCRYSFVHVDVDIYRSVLDCAAWFYPRLVVGGVMVFDDYGFPSCPGAKAAVDEYFADSADRPVYLPTGQSVVFKH